MGGVLQDEKWTTNGLRLLDIHLFNAPAGRVVSRRAAEAGELIVMLKGVYRAAPFGAHHVQAHAGDVVCWMPGVDRVEEGDAQSPTKCFAIYFDWPPPAPRLPLVMRDHHGMVRALSERLLAVHASPLGIPSSVSDAYLAGIMAEYRHLAAPVLEHSLVARVTQYIEDHLAETFSLVDLARHVGLQKRHFTRKFKELTCQTPMRYVRHQRALRALGVLSLHPARSLKKVAAHIGVSDELQVRRILRRYCGVSVRELRLRKSVLRQFEPVTTPAEPPVRSRLP